jgi:hypothetical protein
LLGRARSRVEAQHVPDEDGRGKRAGRTGHGIVAQVLLPARGAILAGFIANNKSWARLLPDVSR